MDRPARVRLFKAPVYPPSPFRDDPDYPRAAAWLAAGAEHPQALVAGVPFSKLSLSGARCDLLPESLRAALWSFSTFQGDTGVELERMAVSDLGDVDLDGLAPGEALETVRSALRALSGGPPVAVVGGDNSITAPAMLALTGPGGGLITLDAHHDLRDYRRDGPSNGSPVRVLLDSGVEGPRIRQIGIADFANSRVYSDLATGAGIGVSKAAEVHAKGIGAVIEEALADLSGTDGIYVDVDLDVVERALAPGAPAAQPGGLLPRDLARAAFLCGRDAGVKALDIVEVDPERDVAGATVRLAALVLLSFLAGVSLR